jgi:N-acetylmuramoyl-L-alanine amidase
MDYFMKKYRIYIINKKLIYISVLIVIFLSLILLASIFYKALAVGNFQDPKNGIIVIDPGHGGIDGGASKGNLLEKDVNLDISKRLKQLLLGKGYYVILTREDDISLEDLYRGNGSRHQKDLKARIEIINNSNAQLFVSIHCNCHIQNPNANGTIVLYSDTFSQNKDIAYSIQRSLNNITINGEKRTIHDPVWFTNLLILNTAKVPGVLVETAFLTNEQEHSLLSDDSFKETIAEKIADSIDTYLNSINHFLSQ